MVPPAVLQFRKWLTIWSGESAKLQDANEVRRFAAVLKGGLNGACVRTRSKDREAKDKEDKDPRSSMGRWAMDKGSGKSGTQAAS